MEWRMFGGLVLVCVFVASSNLLVFFETHRLPAAAYGAFLKIDSSYSMLFTGDVLLARDVEMRAQKSSFDAIFSGTASVLASADASIINFESALASPHRTTPWGSVQFSTATSALPAITTAGIDVVSLANNHSLDCGVVGYQLASTSLLDHEVKPIGHPGVVSSSSVTYVDAPTGVVAVVAINFVGVAALDFDALVALMEGVGAQSDFQIAYVHWGLEYETTHSPKQAERAAQLVAAGFDTVIGHHPHVVQDIQLVDEVPVFYSLGNFVFDQYFSTEVQQGLLVRVVFDETEIVYDLIPVTSLGSKTNPRLMPVTERITFLEALSARSAELLQSDILQNRIVLPRQ